MIEEKLISDKENELNVQGQKIDLNPTKKKKEEKKIDKDLDNLLAGYSEVKTDTSFSSEGSKTGPGSSPGLTPETTEEPKKKRRRRKKAEPQIISGEVINGAMLLTLVDMFCPMLIGFIHDRLTRKKGKRFDYKKLKLNAAQKSELDPIVNEVMKTIDIKANPTVILIVSLISIYGMNYLSIKQEMDLEDIAKYGR